MPRVETFTFRVNADERHLLTEVANRLERTESDAVRLLVRKAARELDVLPCTQQEARREAA